MYDFINDKDLCEFFNVNPEEEQNQKFSLNNREEVSIFEKQLHKHVKSETGISHCSLNLLQAFDYCMTLDERGATLFSALLDLKITIAFLFIDFIKYAPDYKSLNKKDGTDILEDESLFNKKMKMLHHNIDLAIRYRAFYDKLMGVLLLLLEPSKYNEYNDKKGSRKKNFFNLVGDNIDNASLLALQQQITYLDDKYRTPEVHQTGSMRTWVLTSQDLFLDKQLNLMNYMNWIIGYAEWLDKMIKAGVGS